MIETHVAVSLKSGDKFLGIVSNPSKTLSDDEVLKLDFILLKGALIYREDDDKFFTQVDTIIPYSNIEFIQLIWESEYLKNI